MKIPSEIYDTNTVIFKKSFNELIHSIINGHTISVSVSRILRY